MFYFFFQAEDGIRDIGVTGVQTCALPIFRPGDTIAYAATIQQLSEQGASIEGKVTVGSELVAEIELMFSHIDQNMAGLRSEERRVGEEWRSRGSPDH